MIGPYNETYELVFRVELPHTQLGPASVASLRHKSCSGTVTGTRVSQYTAKFHSRPCARRGEAKILESGWPVCVLCASLNATFAKQFAECDSDSVHIALLLPNSGDIHP